MALETKLLQKLSQSLLMTPQLQQAIKLLQLGRLEYQEAIEKELLENPVLEESREMEDQSDAPDRGDIYAEASAAPAAQDQISEPKGDWDDYLDTFTDSRGSASARNSSGDFEDRPSLEATLTRNETLQDCLFEQIRMLDIPETDWPIVSQVIGNLDRDGYLCVSYLEIAENCGCELDAVERIMDLVRTLDPVGVGARDLPECLIIQLEKLGKGDTLEASIIRNHLDKLERRKYDQIAKQEQRSVEEVYKAVTAIQSLNPRPGRPFSDESVRYVVPDVYVYKVGREYVISLNEEGLPKLRVSPYYQKMLNNGDGSVSKAYLNERLKAASWLIKSMHQRQQTIFKVTESIVKFQREFLDHGIGKLKPLVLKDVADDIGMHESTVSRIKNNKYMHTPQGVFEFGYFFTTGIKTSTGDVSSSTIKERIRTLIAAEPPNDPISDQKIVDVLKSENVDIARRTVAKYRETLGIPSSSRRKKPF